MTFVTSGLAIAGVVAVSIPILIHLLSRQRRKPIEWAAMRFLIEAFRKHKRRLQIEQLLLLAVRCLIVALLGFALARPILESAGIIAAGGSRAVYLVMDDGMISGVTGADGRTALQRHVRQAIDLVNTLGPGDSIGVITAARPAHALIHPPSTDHGGIVNLLQSLAPKESPTDLAGAFSFVRGAVEDSRKTQQQTMVYLFSEFRGGSADLEAPLPVAFAGDAANGVALLASPPAAQPVNNVQIVSIEPVRSVIVPGANDGSEQITVRLARTGGAASASAEVSRVRLSGEGLPQIEPRTVQWQPGQTHAEARFTVNYGHLTDRTLALSAAIDDDALNADNQHHAVLHVRRQLRVLMIDRRAFGFERSLDQLTAGQWIRRALEPRESASSAAAAPGGGAGVQVVEVEPAALDLADLRPADVAVLPRPDLLTDAGWVALRQFVHRGGLLIITPPGEANIHQWTERLSKDLNLDWRLALETRRHDEGLALAEEQPASELLRLISSDLPDLARPVQANRLLPIDRETLAAGHAQPLLVFADGTPLVIAGSPEAPVESGESETSRQSPIVNRPAGGGGLVIYLAAAPELSWTNLPSKPLMVPLMQELVRQGLSAIRSAQRLQVGERPSLAGPHGPAARDLIGPDGSRIALDPAGRPQQPLERAGVYALHDQSNQPIGQLAVNIDSAAGITDVQSAAAVSSWLSASGPWRTFDASNIAASLATERQTSPIAGALLWIVLALVILETILARRFSHAYADASPKAAHGVAEVAA